MKTSFEEGYSFDCVGKLAEPHEFKWRQVVHVNEYCYCVYTPLKGMIRFLMAAPDADGQRQMMEVILQDAKPDACCECGKKGFVGDLWRLTDKKVYCSWCLLRTGIVTWEEGKYVWHLKKKGQEDVLA